MCVGHETGYPRTKNRRDWVTTFLCCLYPSTVIPMARTRAWKKSARTCCRACPKWNFHQDSQKIVLVGHSFGGLVIKSLMVEVDKAVNERARNAIEKEKQARCKAFQVNVKGIMFYAVPHTGANKNFKTYLTDCNNIAFLQNSKRLTGLMRTVDTFSRQMVELSTDFEYSVPEDINLFAIVEGLQVVVPEASARKLARNMVIKIEDANHMQVCQPLDEFHESYRTLLQFVKDIRNANQQV
ncbi:unnamed protein product [Sphagnum jensenii]|uniref:DUF676 domain-containing protein n=1 Tax=Sphagnum jensenii TaxID=128206 RepID=A0ABP1A9A4_9BRYO